MPRVQGGSADGNDYTPIPDGKYAVMVKEVEEKRTKNNDIMWQLKLEVTEGVHEGRHIYDNITFSEKGQNRVRILASRVAKLDVETDFDLEKGDLLFRPCEVDVTVETYEAKDGLMKSKNSISFAGYHKVEATEVF